MPFDFSDLPHELEKIDAHHESMRQELFQSYGKRAVPFYASEDERVAKLSFDKTSHSAWWSRKLKATSHLCLALSEITNVQDFNYIFAQNFSEHLSFRREYSFLELDALTDTEKLFHQLRTKVNDNQEDMFVPIMHCLSQRRRKFLNESLHGKCEILKSLIGKIRVAVERTTTPTNPMAFYWEIVSWELEGVGQNNKVIMSEPWGLTFFTMTTTQMLDHLKSNLLEQALLNENITLEQKKAIKKASKKSSEAEKAELKSIFSSPQPPPPPQPQPRVASTDSNSSYVSVELT